MKYIVKFQIKQPKNLSSVDFQWDLVDSYRKNFPNILINTAIKNIVCTHRYRLEDKWQSGHFVVGDGEMRQPQAHGGHQVRQTGA